MTEEERLELTSAVTEEGYEKLDTLAEKLDEVDEEIKQTGSNVGADDVVVDVEVHAADALAELEAVQAAIDDIDRSVTVDVESEGIGDVGASQGGRAVTSGGVPPMGDPDDIISPEREVDVKTLRSRLGADIFGGDTGSLADLFPEAEGVVDMEVDTDDVLDPRFGASRVDRDVPQSQIAGRFGESDTFVSPERSQDLMAFLHDEDVRDRGLRARLRGLRGSISGLKDELMDFRFTASELHELFAAIFPLMALFAGALPAAVTGVAALGTAALTAAGALGAIAGLGAMGVSLQQTGQVSAQPIRNELQQVKDAFVNAFAPLARQFAPVVTDAIAQVEAMMAPLADASEALLLFTDEFRSLTEFITSNLPGVVSSLLTFTHALTPLIGGIVNFVANSGILGFMSNQLADALPALAQIGRAIAELLPLIVRMSQGFLDLVSAIAFVLSPLMGLLNTFPVLAKMLGVVAGGLLLIIGLTSLFTSSVLRTAGAAILSASESLITFATSATTASMGMQIAVAGVLGLAAAIGIVLLPTIGDLLGGLFGVNEQLERAQKNLKKFRKERNRIAGGMGAPSASPRGRAVYNDNSTIVIEGQGNPHEAARAQYSAQYQHSQRVNSIFGN